MHRVYFDENEQVGGGYALWLPKSKADLALIGPALCDGLRVLIEWTGECEMEANLSFDVERDTWVAIGDHSTYVVHPEAAAAHAALKAKPRS
jgi:hypothetical protein